MREEAEEYPHIDASRGWGTSTVSDEAVAALAFDYSKTRIFGRRKTPAIMVSYTKSRSPIISS